jgi:hypothetical protein
MTFDLTLRAICDGLHTETLLWVTCLPTSPDARCPRTTSQFGPPKSLTRKSTRSRSIRYCSIANSPLGHPVQMDTSRLLVILSILSLAPSIALLAVRPCSIATVGISSRIGALERKATPTRDRAFRKIRRVEIGGIDSLPTGRMF